MAEKSKPQPVSEFSIDEFIGEMEKAEDERLAKRLPQERLKNKRQLDNAARRAAEAAGLGDGKLVPQPLAKEEKPKKPKASDRSAATGMQLKAPRSKANAVERPDFSGFGEPEQAGFGHVPSAAARSAQNENARITARDISRAAAKDPSVMATMRDALATATETATTSKAKVPGSRTPGKKVALPGQNLEGAQTVGISAT
ncbi:MAG: hypothetical protein ABL879_17575, partial [Devosia sp.]